MASIFTTAGLALLATRRQTADPVIVDQVQIGSLAPAQRYNPTAGQVALVDSAPLEIRGSAVTWTQAQAQVQYDIQVPAQAAALALSEVGFWVGSTLLAVAADAAGDLGAFARGRAD